MRNDPFGACAMGVPSGAGIGMRSQHVNELLDQGTDVPWFELLADNHLAPGGIVPAQVQAMAERWPLTLHCVGMNLGGQDGLDWEYLQSIRELASRTHAAWVSDHLCFTACHGRQFHDLLPVPYTDEAMRHIAERVAQIQEFLGQPLVIENVSAYLRFRQSAMTEAQFLNQLVAQTGCEILLDINNLYVNHVNHGDDVMAYLDTLPLNAVREVHLAGYEDKGHYLLDAHNHRVSAPVWDLYEKIHPQIAHVPVLIEWDNDIPAFAELREEALRAGEIIVNGSRSAGLQRGIA